MWCSFILFSLWYVKLYERFFKYIDVSTKNIDLPAIFETISYNKKTASYLEAVTFKSFNRTTLANAPNTTL
ncbi:hypothetical protein COM47_04650 [Bacillus wiedmannii]|nr:hypothetical protein ICW_02742 [Bacillus wiedmannii]EJV64161.1 hypothetical protein IEO_02418 [Bacillus wiedmannii]PGB67763.1 hypothetical protein COM12_13205 [Bacillus wiedmannii]PGD88123.1 hypothetical protein COM47_04650 [Bacillus wiedmannii]